jgi:hypothetical protein
MKKLKHMGLIAIVCLIGLGVVLGARSGRFDTVSRSNGDTARHSGTATTVASATAFSSVR